MTQGSLAPPVCIRVIDVETTGFPPDAAVCEIGWTDVFVDYSGAHIAPESHGRLINPGRDIPDQVVAIHGITNEMVADAPRATEVFREVMAGADMFCAHNCSFEQNFFGGGDAPWICTLRAVREMYPTLPNHKNGTVPGFLGIDLDPARSYPLHRAAPDTYVTARILQRLIADGFTVARAVNLTKQPPAVHAMPFGAHKGKRMSELPYDYLVWARGNIRPGDVLEGIKAELSKREARR